MVLKALQESESIQEIGKKYDFHPNQIFMWKSQFSSPIFTMFFDEIETKLSMDGKGRWIDNVFIEWFWRKIKLIFKGTLSKGGEYFLGCFKGVVVK